MSTDIAPDLKDLLPPKVTKDKEHDDRPLEYLWVYDPEESVVHIEKGESDHPAKFPTHGNMATHVHHPDRRQGYAYAIHGGWRICDDEHNRIDDPFIVKRVLAALRKEHPPEPLPYIRYHGDPLRDF